MLKNDTKNLKPFSTEQPHEDSKKVKLYTAAIAIFAFILSIFAYRAALSNYFTGDDFVYLNWLQLAAIEPQRLWSVFWSNSLEAQATHFYRPLLSLSMALDQWLWGRNALGFHFTNLFFHTICSVQIYFLVRDFLLPRNSPTNLKMWPVLSASLFLLYPLHPEVVTWIGGRVDCVATSFVLASLYSYAFWRRSKNNRWLGVSLAALTLGLCSKEVAIMIPAVCLAFEFICIENTKGSTKTKLLGALSSTKWFWLSLIVYFIVRRLSLGMFIGGYDDKLSLGIDLQTTGRNWLNSIAIMFVPINTNLMTSRTQPFFITWILIIITTLWSLLKTYLTDKRLRAPVNFQFCALIIFLIPVYKIMCIACDLESSRLAYLASVPLCSLLALGVSSQTFLNSKAGATSVVASMFLLLNAYELNLNNKAWEKAGIASNGLQQTFADLQKSGVRTCVTLGVPDCINGAYVARNALPEMHDKKLRVQSLPLACYYQPVWALKEFLLKSEPDAIYQWNDEQTKLLHCEKPAQGLTQTLTYASKGLQEIFPKENKASFDESGLHVSGSAPKTIILSHLRKSAIDAVTVSFSTTKNIPEKTMQLVFHNSFDGIIRVPGQTNSPLVHESESNKSNPENNLHTVTFTLRGLSDWQIDGASPEQFLFCPNAEGMNLISAVSFQPISQLAPTLSLTDNYAAEKPGIIPIDSSHPAQSISFRLPASSISKRVLLEISKPDIWFDYPNASEQRNDEFPTQKLFNKASGTYMIDLANFDKSGAYYVRTWAVGDNGRVTGLASDHLRLQVDLAQKASQ